MKLLITLAMFGLFCGAAGAQGTTPAQPAVQAPAGVKAPAALVELKKKHGQALAALKKSQEEAIQQLKASMKGKSAAEIRAAIGKQRIADNAAFKALKDAQSAEIEQFKKDHPEAGKKADDIRKQGLKALPLPKIK